MRERLTLWMLLFMVLGWAGRTYADATLPGRFYSEGSSGTGISSSRNPNERQPDRLTDPYPGLQDALFDIGAEVYHYEYEEPGIMELKGLFYGVRFGFTGRDWVPSSWRKSEADGGIMFRAEGRFAYGQVDYDGSIVDLTTGITTPYTMNNNDDWIFEGRLLLGGDRLHRSMLHTIYAGLGYRYLNDDSSSDPAGYERESTYIYVPIGYAFDSSQKYGWSLGFGVEFDLFLLGNQKSALSDVNPTFPNVDNRQESGYGYRASVKFQHKSKKNIFVIEPFIRYWDIDDSEDSVESVGILFEPANETTEAGISILWMY